MTPFWRSLLITIAVAGACGFAGARLAAPPPAAGPALRAKVSGLLQKDLDLTRPQADQVAAIGRRFAAQDQAIQAALEADNDAVAAALGPDMTSTAASEAALGALSRDFIRLQRSGLAYVAEVGAVLTPEQRRRYDATVQAALKAKAR